MNIISRTITGIIGIILGIVLIIAGIYDFPFLFYGIGILIISIFILFNKNEDRIEKIKK